MDTATSKSKGDPGSTTHTRQLPAFLRKSRAGKIHASFVDLEWAQRNRLAQGLKPSQPPSQWARRTGDEVLKRNRYLNIDPFSNNRIHLRVPEGHDDYINASPIRLRSTHSGKHRNFIATQGPKQSSIGHLWRMIWHETGDPAVIVMLTQTYEAGREKCFQYFPHDAEHNTLLINEKDEFQDGFRARVELLNLTKDAKSRSTVRQLRLSVGDQSRIVWHFLFEKWADFAIPESEDRLALLELVKQSAAKNSGMENPRIVHCSAGVGRSGTFIALDYLLDELADGALDDVPADRDRIAELVDALRRQRMMMVQSAAQYHFLYDVLKQQWLERHADVTSSAVAEMKTSVVQGIDDSRR